MPLTASSTGISFQVPRYADSVTGRVSWVILQCRKLSLQHPELLLITHSCGALCMSSPHWVSLEVEGRQIYILQKKAAEMVGDLGEAKPEPLFNLVGGLCHRANELQILPFKRKG